MTAGVPPNRRIKQPSYWTGTFLVAAFLIPDGGRAWPRILDDWATSGLLGTGSADLIDVDPRDATSLRILGSHSIPGIKWADHSEKLVVASKRNFVTQLVLPIHGVESLAEARINAIINDDGTLTIYGSVPYDHAYTFQAPELRMKNLRLFLDFASRLLPQDLCLVGAIDEEMVIDGLGDARQTPEKLVDWAFYGTWMTETLHCELGDQFHALKAQARKWRVLGDKALFVHWSDWESVNWAPAIWTDAVAAALRKFQHSLRQ